MSERHLNRVSCKAALYTSDRTKVLVIESMPGKLSLPGGHMEDGETPDEAMKRELYEELGLKGVELQRKDFWMHKSGKLVLGFTGTLNEDTPLTIQEEELERALWVVVADVADRSVPLRSYTDFICSQR